MVLVDFNLSDGNFFVEIKIFGLDNYKLLLGVYFFCYGEFYLVSWLFWMLLCYDSCYVLERFVWLVCLSVYVVVWVMLWFYFFYLFWFLVILWICVVVNMIIVLLR